MAIIRCPYCHAIIDENDKYCNNCGTQLLFPDDESVEEEIPGEKIIDVEEDAEEKDYDVDEPAEQTTSLMEKDEAGDTGEERTGEIPAAPEPEPGSKALGNLIEAEDPGAEDTKVLRDEDLESDEDESEEVTVLEEIAAREAAPEASEEETKAYAVRLAEKAKPEEETAEMVPPPEPERRPAEARPEPVVPVPPPPVPATFDTRELDSLGKTVDLGKERVDKMIQVMAEKQKEAAAPAPEDAVPEKKTGTLPPWADKIKGAAGIVEREETQEVGRRFDRATLSGTGVPATETRTTGEEAGAGEPAEEEIFPRRKPSDSGIGLPERVAQGALPFGPPAAEAEEDEGEEAEAAGPAAEPAEPARPAREEAPRFAPEKPVAEAAYEAGMAAEEEVPRPPFQFSVFFKSKAFDVLFIGVFWLVALWVAARSMDATLFELLSVTSTPVLLLYGIFLGLYFFLFKFFLGETLGDRLFKERD